ncbi:uncharacterized protein M6B38_382785 [Iris pallida]|uniref:Uncharacterized protein n=1 Tax=Iris pallida TaxID=29817 RepID=A0AAX6G7L8_IRIPA|nr:uncharacterized protein M6B38_382785 [Iris pallida]
MAGISCLYPPIDFLEPDVSGIDETSDISESRVSDGGADYPLLQDLNIDDEHNSINGSSISQTNEDQDSITKVTKSTDHKGRYFYYDSPLYEDTGIWIPVSVPPMTKSDHEECKRGFSANGAYFPEGDISWDQLIGGDKETTMWDVVADMLLAAKGKVSSLAYDGLRRGTISLLSTQLHLLEQNWEEMATTLTQANFGNAKEILDTEPPRWLADSASTSCMLCSSSFHPIMCSRHHCRFVVEFSAVHVQKGGACCHLSSGKEIPNGCVMCAV